MSKQIQRGVRRWRRAALTTVCAAGLCLALQGCQKGADSAAVAAEQARPVHRFDRLQSVARAGDRVVAVGSFGVVLSSDDGGVRWSRQELPGAPGLIKAAACGAGGFALLDIDGTLWKGDGQAAWTSAKLPADDALLDMTCTADGHLWVVGARGAILTSADGGKTWTAKSLDEDIQLLNVQFPSADVGIIAGEFGRVLLTRDGGAHWAEGGSLGSEFYPQAMDFRDDLHGVVVGLGGAVQDTADGGKTWRRTKAPTEAPLYGVLDAPDATLVVGAVGTGFKRVGDGWEPVKGLPMTDLRGLALTPARILVAGGGGVAVLPSATLAGAN